MTKLGLVFIVAFCAVQLTWAARLTRDTEAVDTSTESFLNQAEKVFGELQNNLKQTFTKENFDKFTDTVSKHASDINSQLKELATDVQGKIKEFSKEGDEKKN